VQAAIAEPVSFGLENVTDREFSNGVVVPNPDEYFYWDDNHFHSGVLQDDGPAGGDDSPQTRHEL
jgi:hypothetical protein